MTSPTQRFSPWARMTRAQRENLNGHLLTAPTLLVILAIVIVPFLAVIVFAFADLRLVDIPYMNLGNIEWTLDNIIGAMESKAFWGALGTTIAYATLTTLGAIVCGLAIALAIRRPFRGRGVVRALLLVPYVLPVIAAATIWRTMLNPQYGLINAFGLEFLGWDRPIGFLNTSTYEVFGVSIPLTLLTVVAFEVWKTTPLTFLFITARLQSIPGDIEEAAALDGASSRKILTQIVAPQLRAVVLLLILLRFIWSFQSFNDIYLLTGGAGGTQVMAVKVYTELITRADIGSAASYGLLMSVILAVLLVFYVLLSRRKETL
ncbi:carbohydrate ABC transporter permease [Occultella gossypii]|uniref:carbohydrate ABC transporter permease n=1 Tax=Occultella gossypii TaxID=2800820 RepID=UPI001CBB01BF|nr:sugar ABC transporter permease [Occultella gossypii]